MKRFFLLLVLFFKINAICPQPCEIRTHYDEIESFNWPGGWRVGTTAGFSSEAFVTPGLSTVLYGVGSSASAYETNWYILPNISGLSPFSTHVLRFRLASYRFTSNAATRGVDLDDYITVHVSTNGGATYSSELRVTGNNNSFWSYNSTAVASKTANGTLTVFSPSGGGDRTLTGDGYSFIELVLSPGMTQCAVAISCRANSFGEEWWIDNIEFIKTFSCDPLPVDLVEFRATSKDDQRVELSWQTSSESNNSFFKVERSVDGFEWHEISRVTGSGNSNHIITYYYIDNFPFFGKNYYRLTQVDFDGEYTRFNPIAAFVNGTNSVSPCAKYYDLTGRHVPFEKLVRGVLYFKVCNGRADKVVILD